LVSVIAIAPGNSDVIYLGYTNGKCYISRNRGGSFEPISDGLPVRYISDIAVDPQSPETLYVSISGFHSGHIYKSTNGGKNWKDISGMLPDVPANTVLLNPQKPSEVLLGTDIGVFVSADEGQTWAIVPGLPIVPVFDLAGNTNVGIFAATHGRGVFRSNPPARKEE
ncbi:MAG TPA: hypothetical protein PLB32_25765, partial [Acidobacteriota bacterium]|nr:hypothetical protein [Acidobacteriota bacterium]